MAYYKLIIIISFCMKFSRYILINISFLWMFHFSLPRFTHYARFITDILSNVLHAHLWRPEEQVLRPSQLTVFGRSTHVFVEITRFELVTPCLQGRCSPNWAIPPGIIQIAFRLMGLNGLEPSTSRLSGVRSNQLSYKPIFFGAYTW